MDVICCIHENHLATMDDLVARGLYNNRYSNILVNDLFPWNFIRSIRALLCFFRFSAKRRTDLDKIYSVCGIYIFSRADDFPFKSYGRTGQVPR